MIVRCSKCEKKYKIDSEKVTEKGVKFTCQNCGNVMVVRKKAEDQEADAEFTPCRVCGNPATIGLDTDQPICSHCDEIEQGKSARFVDMSMAPEDEPSGEREIDLATSDDVSFDSLSGGDFSDKAYSTGSLPGEGKEYISPEHLPLKTADSGTDSTIDFGEIGDAPANQFDQFDPAMMGTRTIEDEESPDPEPKPEPASQKTTPPPQTTTPKAKPSQPTPPPSAKPKGATPPPKQAKPSPGRQSATGPTPAPKQPGKPTPPAVPKKDTKPKESASASPAPPVKDLTPPSMMADTEPEPQPVIDEQPAATKFADPALKSEAHKFDAETQIDDNTERKAEDTLPEQEPVTQAPEPGPVESIPEPEPVKSELEITPPPAEPEMEAIPSAPAPLDETEPQQTSIFPLILSMLLMLTLAVYFFVYYIL